MANESSVVATHDTSIAQTPSLLGRARGSLRLRIVDDARSSEQVVTLADAKCTVGSDQCCTLRLDLPGIESVHCLILRGQRCDVVRSWAGHALLNGRTFQDARLNSGDLLRLGTVEVEVLSDSELEPQSDYEHKAEMEPGVVELAEAALLNSTVSSIPNPVNEQLVVELLATRQQINELQAQVENSADELRRAVEESEYTAEHRLEWETERQSWQQQLAAWDAERAEWECRIQQLEERQAADDTESPVSDPDTAGWNGDDQVSQQLQQRLQTQRDALDREKAAAQSDHEDAGSSADDQIAKLERQAALLAEHSTTRGMDHHGEANFDEAMSDEAGSDEDAYQPPAADPAGPVSESLPSAVESSPLVEDSSGFSSADEQLPDTKPASGYAEPPLTLAAVGLTPAEPLLSDAEPPLTLTPAEPSLPELGDHPVDVDPVLTVGSYGQGDGLRDDAEASKRPDPYDCISADPIAALGEEATSIDPARNSPPPSRRVRRDATR